MQRRSCHFLAPTPQHLPAPREIALRSRWGLALHLNSLALRRRGPDWNGRPTAEAWVPHREEIPRPHPSVPTASLRSDVFGLGASLLTCRPAPDPRKNPGAAAVFLPATSSALSGKPNGAIRPPGRHSACPGPLTAAIPDRLSRPTITLSGFAPGSKIVRHFEVTADR
jgi:hypothetical protein